MQLVILFAVLTSSLYAVARFLLHPNAGAAIASAILLAVFIGVIAWKMNIRRFAEFPRVWAPPLKPWLSLAVTLGVVGMEVLRHGAPIPLAALDAVFAFAFFTFFSSLFVRRVAS